MTDYPAMKPEDASTTAPMPTAPPKPGLKARARALWLRVFGWPTCRLVKAKEIREVNRAFGYLYAKQADLNRVLAHLALVATAEACRQNRSVIRCRKEERENALLFKLVPDMDKAKEGELVFELVQRAVKEPQASVPAEAVSSKLALVKKPEGSVPA